MADSMNRLDGKSATDGTCASELGIANFVGETLRLGATDIRIVAAYDATTVYHPDYGQRGERDFNNWHFLDQIQNALTWAEKRGSVQYVELPYHSDSHTLVSCLESGSPVIKFDGKPIDFPKNSDSSAP